MALAFIGYFSGSGTEISTPTSPGVLLAKSLHHKARSRRAALPVRFLTASSHVQAIAAALTTISVFCRASRRYRKLARRSFQVGPSSLQALNFQNHDQAGNHPSCVGVILLNIGTPLSTSVDDVRAYLSRFLRDKLVIDVDDPKAKEALLQRLEAGAVASAESYKKIWDSKRGSPLLFHSQDLIEKLQGVLGRSYEVRIGFEYSEPSVETALAQLTSLGVEKIILVPMFPHFSQMTVAASLENTCRAATKIGSDTYLQVVPPFYKHPGYVGAASAVMKECLQHSCHEIDHVVFSYHGIPEHQCTRTDESQSVCMKVDDCCSRRCKENQNCYRAQCLETTELLVQSLGLSDDQWSMSFASRQSVRRAVQWITPHTEELLSELPKMGKRKVAICSPSYTVDCIETLGELGIGGRERFINAGGEELLVLPCINSSDTWAHILAKMIQDVPEVGATTQAGSSVRGAWAL